MHNITLKIQKNIIFIIINKANEVVGENCIPISLKYVSILINLTAKSIQKNILIIIIIKPLATFS